MEFTHQHFHELASTQTYLIDHLDQSESNHHPILITTQNQTNGHGQRGRSWSHQPNSLAMSFTYPIHSIPTLSTLGLALEIISYFHTNHSLVLTIKWPNDLFFKGSKVGGIIASTYRSKSLAVGVGINLGENNNYSEFLCLPIKLSCENLGHDLYKHVLQREQLNSHSLKERFIQSCHHIDHVCQFENKNYIFKTIGDNGQAILQSHQGELTEVYSGSLLFN